MGSTPASRTIFRRTLQTCMKLNVLLPWILVLGIGVALGVTYVKSSGKDAELERLRAQLAGEQELRSELAKAEEEIRSYEEQIESFRKEKQELLKLRNEVNQLRDQNQELTKQVQTAQTQIDRAREQANQAAQQAQQMRATVVQTQQTIQRDACINNLRLLDGAKQQWAVENSKQPTDIPTVQDVAPYLGQSALAQALLGSNPSVGLRGCPAGGSYSLNALNHPPTCSIPGHALAAEAAPAQ